MSVGVIRMNSEPTRMTNHHENEDGQSSELVVTPLIKRHRKLEEALLDPSELPEEIFSSILCCLTPADIAQCSLVSSYWNQICKSHTVWRCMCDKLWDDKVYVPRLIREMRATDPRGAYRLSLKDSTRQYITVEELTTFEWCFRFKANPGAEWVERDPWWNDKTPSTHKYYPNGEVKITGDFTGIHPNERRWRWIPRMGGKEGPHGSFVQINHFPPYVFSRHPNWGFIQQSVAAVLTSFPMPSKGECPELEDDALEAIYQKQNRRSSRSRQRSRIAQVTLSLPMQLMNSLLRDGLLDEEEEEEEEEEVEEEEMREEEPTKAEVFIEDPDEDLPVVERQEEKRQMECELD
ncbi:hypothetical protein PROFUN_07493 [Planoprotostelium fungivorum]|uniref:F-box domain-containing protein n=1 Tax=Planoprotostelium fungivorum TaxID=1890364 RepID=A0A2P6NLN2_9EUKA|nr:hypothetical protein PROFUN_07493 [Planoprotostelium fungivorum]